MPTSNRLITTPPTSVRFSPSGARETRDESPDIGGNVDRARSVSVQNAPFARRNRDTHLVVGLEPTERIGDRVRDNGPIDRDHCDGFGTPR
jgi:hypothetical protein